MGDEEMTVLQALFVLLDLIDFTHKPPACGPTEMIAALVPVEIMQRARQAAMKALKEGVR